MLPPSRNTEGRTFQQTRIPIRQTREQYHGTATFHRPHLTFTRIGRYRLELEDFLGGAFS